MTLTVDITSAAAHAKTPKNASFFEKLSLQENSAFHEVPLFMHPQQLLWQQNSSQLSNVGNLATRLGVCTPEMEINGHANTTCLKQSALDTAENMFLSKERLQHVMLIHNLIVIVAEHLVACLHWQIKDKHKKPVSKLKKWNSELLSKHVQAFLFVNFTPIKSSKWEWR